METVAADHYTACDGADTDENLADCPEAKRSEQYKGVTASYKVLGGRRIAWVKQTKCAPTASFDENSVAQQIAGTPVEFAAYVPSTHIITYYMACQDDNNCPCLAYYKDKLVMDGADGFSATGTFKLKPNIALNYENDCKFENVYIHAKDNTDRNSVTNCDMKISTVDQNDRPEWITTTFNVDVKEYAAPKTILGDQALSVFDPDGDQINFSIITAETTCPGVPDTNPCNCWFEIGSCDGKIRVKAGADVRYYPGMSVVTLNIAAKDQGVLTATHDTLGNAIANGVIKVTILNIPEPPTIDGPVSFTAFEEVQGCEGGGQPPEKCRLNAVTPNSNPGRILASDNDGSTLTYQLVTASDFFWVKATDGSVYMKKKLNYETSPAGGYPLRIEVIDALDETGEIDEVRIEHTYTVMVINVNDPPVIVCASASSLTVSENANINDLVTGNVVTRVDDEDCTSGSCTLTSVTYTKTAGSTVSAFNFQSASSPKLIVVEPLDFETTASFVLSIVVADKGKDLDGNGPFLFASCTSITITVIDVNEAPIFSNQARTLEETSVVGTQLTPAFTASDPDNYGRFVTERRDTLTWSIITDEAAPDAGTFIFLNDDINDDVGLLSTTKLLEADVIDGNDPKVSYSMVIEVSDGAIEVTATISITVLQENEPPQLTVPTGMLTRPSVAENSDGTGTIENNALTSFDPDAGDTTSYAITDCTGSEDKQEPPVCMFAISTSNLIMNSAATWFDLDFETAMERQVTVTVTDAAGLTNTQTITLTVTNINDAPTLRTTDPIASVSVQPGAEQYVTQFIGYDDDLLNYNADIDTEANTEVLTLSIKSGNDDGAFEIAPPLIGGTPTSDGSRAWKLRVKDPVVDNLKIAATQRTLILSVTDKDGIVGRFLLFVTCLYLSYASNFQQTFN